MSLYKKRPLSFLLMLITVLSAVITALTVIFIIGYILAKGLPNLSKDLFSLNYSLENVSMTPAIINTVTVVILTLLLAVPVGVFAAVYLVEYAKKDNILVRIISTATETLQGIPSIVFGLFGFILFVMTLKWGYSLISGTITLSLMVLPLIIRTTQESLLSVPDSYREGSFGLGAGKLRTIFKIILPSAAPGIISGIILATGRIVGESAALIFTAGTSAKIAKSPFDSARTLSVHMYALLNEGMHTKQAYATAVILLIVVAAVNLLSQLGARKLAKYHGER